MAVVKQFIVAVLVLVLVLSATLLPISAEAAIAVRQSLGHQSSSNSASFSTLPLAGSTIVVTVSEYAHTVTGADISDNQGHSSYTLATPSITGDSGSNAYIFYISNISAPSGTFTINIPSPIYEWTATEVTGLAASPLDQTLAAKGTGTSLTSGSVGPTGSTAQANEISFAVMSIQNTSDNNAISTPGAGYNELYVQNDTNFNQGGEAAYKILSSTGAQTASWTWSTGGDYSAMIATFMAESSGGGPGRIIRLRGGVRLIGGVRFE